MLGDQCGVECFRLVEVAPAAASELDRGEVAIVGVQTKNRGPRRDKGRSEFMSKLMSDCALARARRARDSDQVRLQVPLPAIRSGRC